MPYIKVFSCILCLLGNNLFTPKLISASHNFLAPESSFNSEQYLKVMMSLSQALMEFTKVSAKKDEVTQDDLERFLLVIRNRLKNELMGKNLELTFDKKSKNIFLYYALSDSQYLCYQITSRDTLIAINQSEVVHDDQVGLMRVRVLKIDKSYIHDLQKSKNNSVSLKSFALGKFGDLIQLGHQIQNAKYEYQLDLLIEILDLLYQQHLGRNHGKKRQEIRVLLGKALAKKIRCVAIDLGIVLAEDFQEYVAWYGRTNPDLDKTLKERKVSERSDRELLRLIMRQAVQHLKSGKKVMPDESMELVHSNPSIIHDNPRLAIAVAPNQSVTFDELCGDKKVGILSAGWDPIIGFFFISRSSDGKYNFYHSQKLLDINIDSRERKQITLNRFWAKGRDFRDIIQNERRLYSSMLSGYSQLLEIIHDYVTERQNQPRENRVITSDLIKRVQMFPGISIWANAVSKQGKTGTIQISPIAFSHLVFDSISVANEVVDISLYWDDELGLLIWIQSDKGTGTLYSIEKYLEADEKKSSRTGKSYNATPLTRGNNLEVLVKYIKTNQSSLEQGMDAIATLMADYGRQLQSIALLPYAQRVQYGSMAELQSFSEQLASLHERGIIPITRRLTKDAQSSINIALPNQNRLAVWDREEPLYGEIKIDLIWHPNIGLCLWIERENGIGSAYDLRALIDIKIGAHDDVHIIQADKIRHGTNFSEATLDYAKKVKMGKIAGCEEIQSVLRRWCEWTQSSKSVDLHPPLELLEATANLLPIPMDSYADGKVSLLPFKASQLRLSHPSEEITEYHMILRYITGAGLIIITRNDAGEHFVFTLDEYLSQANAKKPIGPTSAYFMTQLLPDENLEKYLSGQFYQDINFFRFTKSYKKIISDYKRTKLVKVVQTDVWDQIKAFNFNNLVLKESRQGIGMLELNSDLSFRDIGQSGDRVNIRMRYDAQLGLLAIVQNMNTGISHIFSIDKYFQLVAGSTAKRKRISFPELTRGNDVEELIANLRVQPMRGWKALPNPSYDLAIRKAIGVDNNGNVLPDAKPDFYCTTFAQEKIRNTNLKLDDKSTVKANRLGKHAIENLSYAISTLTEDERNFLDGSKMLFIKDMSGHYGLSRNQYYFDPQLLKDDRRQELIDQLHHEISERQWVIRQLEEIFPDWKNRRDDPDIQKSIFNLTLKAHYDLIKEYLGLGVSSSILDIIRWHGIQSEEVNQSILDAAESNALEIDRAKSVIRRALLEQSKDGKVSDECISLINHLPLVIIPTEQFSINLGPKKNIRLTGLVKSKGAKVAVCPFYDPVLGLIFYTRSADGKIKYFDAQNLAAYLSGDSNSPFIATILETSSDIFSNLILEERRVKKTVNKQKELNSILYEYAIALKNKTTLSSDLIDRIKKFGGIALWTNNLGNTMITFYPMNHLVVRNVNYASSVVDISLYLYDDKELFMGVHFMDGKLKVYDINDLANIAMTIEDFRGQNKRYIHPIAINAPGDTLAEIVEYARDGVAIEAEQTLFEAIEIWRQICQDAETLPFRTRALEQLSQLPEFASRISILKQRLTDLTVDKRNQFIKNLNGREDYRLKLSSGLLRLRNNNKFKGKNIKFEYVWNEQFGPSVLIYTENEEPLVFRFSFEPHPSDPDKREFKSVLVNRGGITDALSDLGQHAAQVEAETIIREWIEIKALSTEYYKRRTRDFSGVNLKIASRGNAILIPYPNIPIHFNHNMSPGEQYHLSLFYKDDAGLVVILKGQTNQQFFIIENYRKYIRAFAVDKREPMTIPAEHIRELNFDENIDQYLDKDFDKDYKSYKKLKDLRGIVKNYYMLRKYNRPISEEFLDRINRFNDGSIIQLPYVAGFDSYMLRITPVLNRFLLIRDPPAIRGKTCILIKYDPELGLLLIFKQNGKHFIYSLEMYVSEKMDDSDKPMTSIIPKIGEGSDVDEIIFWTKNMRVKHAEVYVGQMRRLVMQDKRIKGFAEKLVMWPPIPVIVHAERLYIMTNESGKNSFIEVFEPAMRFEQLPPGNYTLSFIQNSKGIANLVLINADTGIGQSYQLDKYRKIVVDGKTSGYAEKVIEVFSRRVVNLSEIIIRRERQLREATTTQAKKLLMADLYKLKMQHALRYTHCPTVWSYIISLEQKGYIAQEDWGVLTEIIKDVESLYEEVMASEENDIGSIKESMKVDFQILKMFQMHGAFHDKYFIFHEDGTITLKNGLPFSLYFRPGQTIYFDDGSEFQAPPMSAGVSEYTFVRFGKLTQDRVLIGSSDFYFSIDVEGNEKQVTDDTGLKIYQPFMRVWDGGIELSLSQLIIPFQQRSILEMQRIRINLEETAKKLLETINKYSESSPSWIVLESMIARALSDAEEPSIGHVIVALNSIVLPDQAMLLFEEVLSSLGPHFSDLKSEDARRITKNILIRLVRSMVSSRKREVRLKKTRDGNASFIIERAA